VEPRRSQNMTVSWRRSASGVDTEEGGGSLGTVSAGCGDGEDAAVAPRARSALAR